METVVYLLCLALWSFGTGYTAKLLDDLTNWDIVGMWAAALFLWPAFLLGVWGFMLPDRITKWLDAKQETKALAAIQIKNGARIADWEQYRQLTGLCAKFEAENGIDDRNLLGER